MDQATRQRGAMALMGALGGTCFYALGKALDNSWLDHRLSLALLAFSITFFTAALALAGPLTLRRAVTAAAVLALLVAGLLGVASLRFLHAEEVFNAPTSTLAAITLTLVPLPFVLAAYGPGWRNYAALFSGAWTIVVRYAAAWLFVAVVWAVIALSNLLLTIVGVTVIEDLLDVEVLRWVISGVALGLGLAVVTELSDLVSPYLVLRLLRLLLPVVLVVVLVFIIALPIKGLTHLFGNLSAATVLLSIAALAATLVTVAIDASDEDAEAPLWFQRATQLLALIMVVPSSLGAWAVWLRVAQYGWTPERVLAAMIATLALGYAGFFLVAVLRGAGWPERIRQGNITMALAVLALAFLSLTPVLDGERIAAASQVARLRDGRTPAAAYEQLPLAAWGIAGARAKAEIAALAAEPGREDLAARLAQFAPIDAPSPELPNDPEALRQALVAALPLRPASATALRDQVLAQLDQAEQRDWLSACLTPLSQGGAGCVMLVADFWPETPGDEAIVLQSWRGGYLRYDGFTSVAGSAVRYGVTAIGGVLPDLKKGEALIAEAQAQTAPPISPAPLNALNLGGVALFLQP